jgi:hypothetical protein
MFFIFYGTVNYGIFKIVVCNCCWGKVLILVLHPEILFTSILIFVVSSFAFSVFIHVVRKYWLFVPYCVFHVSVCQLRPLVLCWIEVVIVVLRFCSQS